MAIKSLKLMADLETTTDKNDLRAWAVCAVDIEKLEIAYLGTDLDAFMQWLSGMNTKVWIHNLKFDGSFILDYLLRKGYKWSPSYDKDGNRLPHKTGEFRTLITDDGLFYSIEVCFQRIDKKHMKKVTFYDSLKKLPFKVAEIAKAFELEESKGSIDYKAPRPIGYQLKQEEKEYIVTDCMIPAKALRTQFNEGLVKMTCASDAMNQYKKITGADNFDRWFPVLPIELDADIRRSYKGGYVYLKPEHKGRRGLQGVTLDVNSLYPWALYDNLLPWGYPIYFEGFPDQDLDYPLWILHLKCTFDLKPGHLPTLQLKNNRRFIETEYLTTSRGRIAGVSENDPVEMWLTNIDFQLLVDHYDIANFEPINGFRFKGRRDMFKPYIDYWMHIKETTTGALRQLAKLMLNSLYGKFAARTMSMTKIPALDPDDDIVSYTYSDLEARPPIYTAVAAFTTAYARNKTIRSAQAVYDRFIYADTDSLHLIGTEIPEGLEVHPTKLGAWKNEGEFTDSKFIRAKTYMETTAKGTKVTCAGMPDNVKEKVTYENFEIGSIFEGKLVPVTYRGGVILEERTFTIK